MAANKKLWSFLILLLEAGADVNASVEVPSKSCKWPSIMESVLEKFPPGKEKVEFISLLINKFDAKPVGGAFDELLRGD